MAEKLLDYCLVSVIESKMILFSSDLRAASLKFLNYKIDFKWNSIKVISFNTLIEYHGWWGAGS